MAPASTEPTWRSALLTPEAAPVSCGGTLRMTSEPIGAKVQPAPRPATKSGPTNAVQELLVSATRKIQVMPMPNIDRPAVRMYLPPNFSDRMPAGPAVNIEPSARGTRTRPVLMGLKPSTDWR